MIILQKLEMITNFQLINSVNSQIIYSKKKIVEKFHKPYPCSEETLKRAHSEKYINDVKNIVCTDFEPKDMLPSIFNSISNDNNYIKNITCTDFEPKDILYVIFKILSLETVTITCIVLRYLLTPKLIHTSKRSWVSFLITLPII